MKGCHPSDYILYAKSFYYGGEPRRCMAILEKMHFLSAGVIDSIAFQINPEDRPRETQLSYAAPKKEMTLDINLHLEAIRLAAQCLFAINQYEDCLTLLVPLVCLEEDEVEISVIIRRLQGLYKKDNTEEINEMAGIYFIFGKCLNTIENRRRSIKYLTMALRIDISCLEAAEYMISNGMLADGDKAAFFDRISEPLKARSWLVPFYRFLLLDEIEERKLLSSDSRVSSGATSILLSNESSSPTPYGEPQNGVSASWLVRHANFSLNHQQIENAYMYSRRAYTEDPFNMQGLTIYIASMVDLKLKTELFFLGHELVSASPKAALSWYCVGCYYWCCLKFDLAQKYVQKSTKIDKKFAAAWILLGHIFSAQEESEHAVSAYRTALRLLPGNHKPMMFMARELMRTNYLSLASHLLVGATKLCQTDPGLFNELGVLYMKSDKSELALEYFALAVRALEQVHLNYSAKRFVYKGDSFACKRNVGLELFNNYAAALRKNGQYAEALFWYDKCLAINPQDADVHTNIGFTYHLMQHFDQAIQCYHKALSISPNTSVCATLLTRAIDDCMEFEELSMDAGMDTGFS